MWLPPPKLLMAEPSYLFLDEPTNHLDLFSKIILEQEQQVFREVLVLFIHDRYLMNRVAENHSGGCRSEDTGIIRKLL